MKIEEKAKAYDEMLQRVKELHETGNALTKKQMEIICPELSESEDERIRIALIKLMTVAGENYVMSATGFEKERLLAYLGKQKESQKSSDSILSDCVSDAKCEDRWHKVTDSLPDNGREVLAKDKLGNTLLARYDGEGWDVSVYDDEDYRCHNGISKWREIPSEKQNEQKHPNGCFTCDEYKKGYEAGRLNGFTAGYNKAMKEQKPAEWSEDYREEDIQTRFAFYTYKDDPSVLYLSNVFVEESSRNHGFGTRILKAAEKVAEAVGAITISLKVKQDSPANAWYRKNGYDFVAFKDGYEWLEKNLEYMKPQPKQEWGEEDDQLIGFIFDLLNSLVWRKDWAMDKKECLERLKSLRPVSKESLQSWKPSEEQMNAIDRCVDYLEESDNEDAEIMESLQEQLHKLM